MELPQTRISISVPIKHLNASLGEQTIGSPRTLKDVLINTGHSVSFLKYDYNIPHIPALPSLFPHIFLI